jgi:hypothetical protein
MDLGSFYILLKNLPMSEQTLIFGRNTNWNFFAHLSEYYTLSKTVAPFLQHPLCVCTVLL